MSWSGFKKAVNRAGTQMMMRSGKVEGSVDREFDVQEANFKRLAEFTDRLHESMAKMLDHFTDLLEVQLNVAVTLDSFYGVYDFDQESDRRKVHGQSGVNNRDGISLEYLKVIDAIKREILPSVLDPFSITVLTPIAEFKAYTDELGRLVKKRYRKKLDYDMLRFKADKIEEQAEFAEKETDKHERTLEGFRVAEKTYFDLNDRLKLELAQFVSMRLAVLDPTFESFIKVQLKFFTDVYQKLATLSPNPQDIHLPTAQPKVQVDAMSRQQYAEGKLDESIQDILLKMKRLNIQEM
ncbi:unnamed protein product [Kuraishia capsulata CBS 1993]|uniref:BAR domain-containing protein n=1 Tax=Kuraishia capsulata CBS 1993 TaxID=1382522 RepID=W6MWE1_9ASCO|nr:uncharacterized protein KUCA_T00003263001 [Kuraishia capsulata CBS 1993]CDK27285.1 unnamed protein product [Kuraishia capsulata CBS 1993]